MTSYEIKQRLKNGLPVEKWSLAKIIQEQESRITELEKQLDLHKNAHHKAVEILRERTKPLNECPHGVDDGACKECYQEQTKPLTDEEIETIYYKTLNKIKFARAIEERILWK